MISIDHDHMTIAVWIVGSTFNGRVARNWVRTRIAFHGPGNEINRYERLCPGDNDVGNSIRNSPPERAEVRVQLIVIADARNQIRGVRIHGRV